LPSSAIPAAAEVIGVENRNSWKAGFGSAENVIQEKRRQDFSSFFDNFFNPRVFFEAASGFYYPLSVLGKAAGRTG
jgi:hypothetical protein